MPTIRSFIALNLTADIHRQLDEIIQSLKQQTTIVRWVPSQNIHLTLKFLGDVSLANIETLQRVLAGEAARHAPFTFTVSGFGAFPNTRWPRVLWVGVQAPAALTAAQHGIEAETQRLGYTGEERPFSPHLTLGRVSNNASPQEARRLSDALTQVKIGELGQVMVKSIVLYRSDLNSGGAAYTPLASFPLGNSHNP